MHKLLSITFLLFFTLPGMAQNVGIGTTTPSEKLEVNGGIKSTGDGYGLTHSSNGVTIGTFIQDSLAGWIGTKSNHPLWFFTNDGYSLMALTTTGNVGIGNVAPGAKLEVTGGVKISDSINIGGQIRLMSGTPGAGKVLTSDATGLASWTTPSATGSHFIGENYGGGIVFYVYDNGQHGLIAATSDQTTGIQWYNGTYRYTGSTGDGLNAGAMNTVLIVATQMSDNQTGNFAAKVCADYSVAVGGITYGDWYLPSKYELNLLYLQKTVVGGFSPDYYWSSSEVNDTSAWGQIFSFGFQNNLNVQYNAIGVRAVRAF